MYKNSATSKSLTRILKNLEPEIPGPRKTLTQKNLDPQKSELSLSWTMKNAGNSWMQQQGLEDHMV